MNMYKNTEHIKNKCIKIKKVVDIYTKSGIITKGTYNSGSVSM